MKKNKTSDGEMPSIPKIDKLIHEPARLMIMAYLFVVESADFLFLKQQTGLTWGNLSAHMIKLEDAGYVKIEKEFIEKKPHTTVRMTEKGRAAFRSYQNSMKDMFEDLAKEEK